MKDWRDTALEVALSVGAIKRCNIHPTVLFQAEDPDLEMKAWEALCQRAAEEGFSGNPDLELQPALIHTLQSADEECSQCA